MPVLLEGSCHCKAVKYTVESNTPVPFVICQCSICRKVGGYMGTSNLMGNTDTLKILRGEDKIKKYQAVKEFDAEDNIVARHPSSRSFCGECSTMLWNHEPQWGHWIYPFAASIDKPNPLPALPEGQQLVFVLHEPGSCPTHVPIAEGAVAYPDFGPLTGVADWHKQTGAWVG